MMILLAASAGVHARPLDADAGAQSLRQPPVRDLDADPWVLPIIASDSGQIEAFFLVESASPFTPSQPAPSVNPIDRLLPSTRSGGLGVAGRVRLDASDNVEAALKLDRIPAMALLCRDGVGLAGSLGTMADQCLLATLGTGEWDAFGSATSRRLEGSWSSARLGLDLSLGLDWIESDPSTGLGGLGNHAWTGAATPLAAFQPVAPWRLGEFSLRGIGATAIWDLGDNRWFGLGGGHARSRLSGAAALQAALPSQWDTSTLSLGVGVGEFSGTLTGRVIEVPGSDPFWNGLDLGFSWRTPWSGLLTIGARNLLSDDEPWLLDGTTVPEVEQGRVPYVRYQQDL